MHKIQFITNFMQWTNSRYNGPFESLRWTTFRGRVVRFTRNIQMENDLKKIAYSSLKEAWHKMDNLYNFYACEKSRTCQPASRKARQPHVSRMTEKKLVLASLLAKPHF